jgi:hypothetical protein
MPLTTFNVNGWVFCKATTVSLKYLFGGGFMFSIVWTIWNARNNLIFEGKKPIWEDILWLLFYFAAGWIRNLNSSFWYTGVDLYRNHGCILAWSA